MTDRLELEPEPEAAAALFGEHLAKGRAFTEALARHGEELGLIGPLELPRLWTRHVLNSALVAPLLRPGRVGDVGSGAGLPGLVLAIIRPDVSFSLIEPMERRVAWLERQVAELELPNVEVVRARAEDAKLRGQLDQVTARAVSALRTLIPITAPLLKPGGQLVLMKGAGVDGEIGSAEKAMRKFRVRDGEVLVLGEGQVSEVTRVFRATVG
ncbi:16S rRNA (guanine(527)-N(7))-methyltransferase RsmG [Agromyces aerolatus]|uniref:16S rRNA (guanine(527)-N(7))-methyltransferase RsmG n=1 Tax=Agromyces sp. LY-1074 TaxID=3074080 RepID=UPI00285BA7DA|nr:MULTISPECIES: 16S rRNA (guanine(527)-N(7))-methyltransferase RsmG [unclassified Agromyces]MDR5699308.1 16S rRNA (guanine(527)-N(7))-methyltransferase RsmG [Agromyces sp. LY-1074]MDR5705604.1 16S rRNA (guanine(527)-N(7))-methyltransferase RsmG [Agromyces sp. LY-1358]